MQLERLLRPDADGRVRGGSPPAGDHGLPRLGAVTDAAGRRSFCGSTSGPFTKMEGCSRS